MEFSSIKIRERNVTVIFNGSHNYFLNTFYGIIAIAERDYEYENTQEGKARFTLYVGNRHCLGGVMSNSAIKTGAKRFISKAENKYINKKVNYITQEKDLANTYVEITHKDY